MKMLNSCTHQGCSLPIEVIVPTKCMYHQDPELISTTHTKIQIFDSDADSVTKFNNKVQKNLLGIKEPFKNTAYKQSRSANEIMISNKTELATTKSKSTTIEIQPASSESDYESSPPVNYRFGSLPHKDSHNIIKVKHLGNYGADDYSYDDDSEDGDSTVSVSQLSVTDDETEDEHTIVIGIRRGSDALYQQHETSDATVTDSNKSRDSESNDSLDHYVVNVGSSENAESDCSGSDTSREGDYQIKIKETNNENREFELKIGSENSLNKTVKTGQESEFERSKSENSGSIDRNRPLSIVAPPIRFNPLPSTGLQTFCYVI